MNKYRSNLPLFLLDAFFAFVLLSCVFAALSVDLSMVAVVLVGAEVVTTTAVYTPPPTKATTGLCPQTIGVRPGARKTG